MFFDSFDSVKEIFVSTIFVYFVLIIVLRIAGKRTMAELNSFDVVLTITIGSIGASTITSEDLALFDGTVAIVTIIFLQYIISKLDKKYDFINKKIEANPTLLYYKGEYLRDNMRQNRISESDLLQQIRTEANTGIRGVAAVILESHGELSIIKNDVDEKDLEELEKYK